MVLVALLSFGLAACDASGDDGDANRDVPDTGDTAGEDVPYVQPNPDGKPHGEPCTADDQCWFNRCIDAPSITGGAFKICTKDCSEGPLAPCALDGTGFTCVRFSPGTGDDLISFCVPTCAGAGDCPAGYDDCRVVVGALKTCAVVPVTP